MSASSSSLDSPDYISTSPELPDNVWLKILHYLAEDNAQNLIDLIRQLSHHPLGRIAQDFSLWQDVKWKGYVPKYELSRMLQYLGQHTRTLHLEGGYRYSENRTSKKIKRSKRGQCSGNQRFLDITYSLLERIRLKCANLTSISFHTCKLDYFSRPSQGTMPRNLVTSWKITKFSKVVDQCLDIHGYLDSSQHVIAILQAAAIFTPLEGDNGNESLISMVQHCRYCSTIYYNDGQLAQQPCAL